MSLLMIVLLRGFVPQWRNVFPLLRLKMVISSGASRLFYKLRLLYVFSLQVYQARLDRHEVTYDERQQPALLELETCFFSS